MTLAFGRGLHLSPLAGRGWIARLRDPGEGASPQPEHLERPPHPDPLHSPSKTGVNALMASGGREKRRRARCNCPALKKGETLKLIACPSSLSRNAFHPTHIGLQHIRHRDRAVSLLVGFHNRNERAADRDTGAVERVDV